MTRVVVLGDHLATAGALADFLSQEGLFAVAVLNGSSAVAELVRHVPDVIVVQSDAPHVATIRALAARSPATVVIASSYDGSEAMQDVLTAGICAWITPALGPGDVVRVIRDAAAGRAWLPSELVLEVLRRARGTAAGSSRDRLGALTPREVEVLQLLVEGRDRAACAQALGVTVATVGTHITHVLAKMDVASGLEAVAVAYDAGMRPRSSH